jgi:hypothetical protein
MSSRPTSASVVKRRTMRRGPVESGRGRMPQP